MFVTIEDIEPNEPAKPVITTTVPVVVAASNTLELAQIPKGISRQVIPVQGRLLRVEHFEKWDSEIWVVTEMNAELGLYDTPIENLHAAISVRKVERIYFALFPLVIETTTVEREC